MFVGCELYELHNVYIESFNLNYDIFVLSETWLVDSIFNGELFCYYHLVYRKDRDFSTGSGQRGGGVLITVHWNIPSSFQSNVNHLINLVPSIDLLVCRCQLRAIVISNLQVEKRTVASHFRTPSIDGT
ncbi:hypothetical protein Trydic_g20442 [Trypoxylus dichotomus]